MKDKKQFRSICFAVLVYSIAGMIGFLTPCNAGTYYFTKIADESTSIPGFLGWVDTFFTFGKPAIDNDKIVFQGEGADFKGIVLARKNSSMVVLASNTTTIPGSSTNQKFTDLFSPDVEEDFYIFFGHPKDNEQMGLYMLERHTSPFLSSTYSLIADTNTTIPGSPSTTFDFFTDDHGTATVNIGTVTYLGGSINPSNNQLDQLGIYQHYSAGTMGWVVDLNSDMPNYTGSKKFEFFGSESSYGEDVAFVGGRKTVAGSFHMSVYTAKAGMDPQVVADWNTTIPQPPKGETGKFIVFTETAISDTKVAFLGYGDKSTGIYAKNLNSQAISKIVNTATQAPGAGSSFVEFGPIGLDATLTMAFIGYTMDKLEPVRGIYLYSFVDGSLSKIISEGDKIDGKTLACISHQVFSCHTTAVA